MDAPGWNGDDDRDFGPDYEEERCVWCGALPSDPCEFDCECPECDDQREKETA